MMIRSSYKNSSRGFTLVEMLVSVALFAVVMLIMGGALLSTEFLSRILSPEEVEGGVILGDYQRFVESQQLFFPPDPTSRKECSVGGAIACNASGARC